MDIILLQDVENLGSKFDVVKVKAGYGRNFLLPKGMAKVANSSNVKHLEEIRKQQSAKIAKKMEDMQKIADQLKDKVLQIGANLGTYKATVNLFKEIVADINFEVIQD